MNLIDLIIGAVLGGFGGFGVGVVLSTTGIVTGKSVFSFIWGKATSAATAVKKMVTRAPKVAAPAVNANLSKALADLAALEANTTTGPQALDAAKAAVIAAAQGK